MTVIDRKNRMKAKIATYYLGSLLVVTGLFAACTEDVSFSSSIEDESKGCIVLSYAVGGSDVLTRTPEPGWEDWNENLITRLDVFVFGIDGQCKGHYGETINNVQAPQVTNDNEDAQKWEIPLSVFGNDIQVNDVVYLIANAPETVALNVDKLADLQGKTLEMQFCNKKQDKFAMDGKIEVNRDMISDVNNIHIGVIPLKRAAAKVRIKFSSKTDWNDVSYRFYHYVSTANLLDLGWDAEDDYLATLQQPLSSYPVETQQMEKVNTESAEADYNYYKDGKQLVFYSYANNWFKPYDDDDTDKENQLVDEKEPIDEDRQTYILLYAPYGEGTDKKWYYYKVPVNYRLPDNNDDINIDPDTYRHLYRLQRNYIYDITVNIDRPGGTELDPGKLVNLTYEVEPWDREDVTVNYEDNLSYRSDKWVEDTYIDYLDEEKTNVHIYSDRPAELRFTIQSPLDATWRAQLNGTDVSSFEFVHKETVDGEERFVGVGATDEGNTLYDGNGNPISQSIYVRCTDPSSEETHSVQLHVYVTYYGQTYELDLTDTEGSDVNYFTITQGM